MGDYREKSFETKSPVPVLELPSVLTQQQEEMDGDDLMRDTDRHSDFCEGSGDLAFVWIRDSVDVWKKV